MKLIKVEYMIEESFIPKNKQNVTSVMEALRNINRDDVKYSYFQSNQDPRSFMHVVLYGSDEAEEYPSSLQEFKKFQAELKEHLVVPPKATTYMLLASSYDM